MEYSQGKTIIRFNIFRRSRVSFSLFSWFYPCFRKVRLLRHLRLRILRWYLIGKGVIDHRRKKKWVETTRGERDWPRTTWKMSKKSALFRCWHRKCKKLEFGPCETFSFAFLSPIFLHTLIRHDVLRAILTATGFKITRQKRTYKMR